jgi:transposase-like protein
MWCASPPSRGQAFPNPESCLWLVRALAVEMHENWLEGTRYLNMDHLREHKKQMLRQAA